MKICDLHVHSCFSDGSDTPEELIRAAEAAGVSALALCDHNTVAGIERFTAAAEGSAVIGVPGIELSADYQGRELHILALFLPKDKLSAMDGLVRDVRARKEQSNIELAESLRRTGYLIDYDEIRAAATGYINRVQIALALLEKGYVSSVDEAMETLLSKDGEHYRPPKRLQALEAIEFIRSLSALPVLAHPFLNLSEEELCEFLPDAKAAGLCAMETDYSTYSEETCLKARAIADRFGILRSGGSDYHGAAKPHISIGTGEGSLCVPHEYFEELRALLG